MSVAYCDGCGARLEEAARLCAECGAPVPPREVSDAAPGRAATAPVTETAPIRPAPPATLPVPEAGPLTARRAAAGPRVPWLPLLILVAGVVALATALYVARPRGVPLPVGEVLNEAPPTPTTGAADEPVATVTLEPAPAASPTVPRVASQGGALPAAPPGAPVSEPSIDVVAEVPTGTPVPTSPPPTATPTPPIVAVFKAREKVTFNVSPEDARVIINGHDIGQADDWDDMGGGKAWKLPEVPGVYWVRFELEKYRSTWIKVIADPEAKDKTADVDTELEKVDKDHKARDRKDRRRSDRHEEKTKGDDNASDEDDGPTKEKKRDGRR